MMETINLKFKELLEDQSNYRISEIVQIKTILAKKYNTNKL